MTRLSKILNYAYSCKLNSMNGEDAALKKHFEEEITLEEITDALCAEAKIVGYKKRWYKGKKNAR